MSIGDIIFALLSFFLEANFAIEPIFLTFSFFFGLNKSESVKPQPMCRPGMTSFSS